MCSILAIETSSELASIALLIEGRMFVRESFGVHTHSQVVLPLVQDVLSEAGVSMATCDAIAFGCGPGSFTGVRTACGIAQGLAFGLQIPVIPVVTLLAMAQACFVASGVCDVLVVQDARMGEVYWAQYHYDGGCWQTVIEPTLSSAQLVLPHGTVVGCGNGFQAYGADLAHLACANNVSGPVTPHAEHIAFLAQTVFSLGQSVHARDAQPLYLRNKVALTTAERKRKVEGAT